MEPTKQSNRIFIVDSGSAIRSPLIRALANEGYTVETGDIPKMEIARGRLVLPNFGATAYDILTANDLHDIVKYRPTYNKPSAETPLEFELYIKLLKDRRSNKHFKMMRRFT